MSMCVRLLLTLLGCTEGSADRLVCLLNCLDVRVGSLGRVCLVSMLFSKSAQAAVVMTVSGHSAAF